MHFCLFALSMLDFGFATSEEICRELGGRLKTARVSQGLQQADLAARAGVSRGTVTTLENTGQSTVNSLVRIVMALGLADQMAALFEFKVTSIAQMEQADRGQRKRVRRKRVRRSRD